MGKLWAGSPAKRASVSLRTAVSARHLPNLLTGLRLLLAIPITLFVLAGSPAALTGAAILFAVAGLTDLLDGYVARRWEGVSTLGAFLDPLADKCVIDGCILALLLRSAFPLPLAVIFMGRDLVVTALRLQGKGTTNQLSPGGLAKVKTLCLYAGLFGILLDRGAETPLARGCWLLVNLAALLSLVTAAGYLKKLEHRLRSKIPFLVYLLFPRPGPLLSLGKIAFFLLGSFIATIAGIPAAGARTWFLCFVFYELVVSQGKYLINDLAGRDSDRHFLRGTRNRCPNTRRGVWLVAAYAAARATAGIAALLLVAGWTGALIGAFTVVLQLVYELLKRANYPSRGGWLFLVVSTNYGLRTLAGMAAVNRAAPLSPMGSLLFLWAGGLGSLFLAIYWQRQGEYYLERRQISPALLARYKPGVQTVYRKGSAAARRGQPLLPERVLQAMAVGGVLFAAPADGGGIWHGILAIAYLCWVLVGLVGLRAASPGSYRQVVFATTPVLLTGVVAADIWLQMRTASLIPFVLVSIAFLSYSFLTSDAARNLAVHGATEIHPTAA